MADFLLELLSEEIPARMQEKACADLARLFAAELAKAGLAADAVETFATPRRLALIARGLPLATEPVAEEVKGPRADAPPQALAGFLGKTGLTREQLVERADAKGNVILFAVTEKPGRATAAVLAEAVPAIIRGFPWPKSMRWGAESASTASLRWVRPLKGIVALLDEMVVPIEIAGIVSGAATVGHRFHHPEPITIGSADDYAFKLRTAHVILDPAERRAIIRDGAAAVAAAAGLTVVPDEGLVAENAGLTEWPVPLLGAFDPAYLAVPREVIQLTMRTNQKYFALVDAAGALAPNFVCTANIMARDDGVGVVAGNAKVLAARLSDAKFFWEQDLKVKLAESAKKLDQIVFHEKLGTVADKVDRVAKLARWLVEEGIASSSPSLLRGEGSNLAAGVTPEEEVAPLSQPSPRGGEGFARDELAQMAETAARLCKADLVTGMVGEFPELQGIMGGYYARAEGYPDAVADAIRDHYKPVGQGDDVPTAPVTVAVSLADKLDTIISFFAIGEKPTGSKDPFALRRAALGVIRTVLDHGLRPAMMDVFLQGQLPRESNDFEAAVAAVWSDLKHDDALAERYLSEIGSSASLGAGAVLARQIQLEHMAGATLSDDQKLMIAQGHVQIKQAVQFDPMSKAASELLDFFADRLKVQQKEAGVRHDLIDAVFALGGEDDLVRLLARVRALQAFVETPDGIDLLAGYKRAANILKKEAPAEAGGSDHVMEPAEAELVAALDEAEPAAEAAVAAEDFGSAMAALSQLRGPIDAFFEDVTVNDPDPAKRAARLALLGRIRAAVHRVADFSRIEG
ncbi:glycine--tRNA ligase subunit beta [Sphingomonas montana]|uniref:glycine--tRNA ligase subunit beta n=1 Tax=Sphingomonas montana TaxID=1843236 RepID=UPI00096D5E00|nr:glycine--tRNA ligase subunit beta [Sphingomonas montana]